MSHEGRCWQRGLAVPLALLMLSSLAALLVVRQLWWQERLLRWQAEQLRNHHLAEGVLALAVEDITAPPTRADGRPNLRQQPGGPNDTHVFYPNTRREHDLLRQRLGGTPCREGLCVSDSPLSAGQVVPSPSAAAWLARLPTAMPISPNQRPASAARGWYWVDILWDANDPASDDSPARFFYRITALVQGALPGSQVMLQAVWQRRPNDVQRGNWSGWHVVHF